MNKRLRECLEKVKKGKQTDKTEVILQMKKA